MKNSILATSFVFFCLFANTGGALAFAGYPMVAQTSASQPVIRTAAVQATGWVPNTVMVGAERQHIKNMHILMRPNRPLHFYGNTVRFLHYRRQSQSGR